jgi:[ribosomal protein S5]-alanine N-acetyltransferase
MTRRFFDPFESHRLRFRLPDETDIDDFHRQFSDPDMCRYFSEPPISRSDAEALVEMFQNPERDGYLRFVLERIQDGAFIGTCGYHHWEPECGQVEIGYDIWKEFWRQGYASESVRPLLEICFKNLQVRQVYVLVHEENAASQGAAAKLGFRPCPPCRPLDENTQLCMKLTREKWSEAQTDCSSA